MTMSAEEKRADRRRRYEARTPEQRAAYKAKAAEWAAAKRAARIAERAALGLAPGCVIPARSAEELAALAREKNHRWRAANLEHARETDRIKARRLAAKRAEAAGQTVEVDLYRPKTAPLTEDEKREKRRLNTAKWAAANLERKREITRDSMRRAAAAKAIAEGREPGKKGRPKQFTPEEKRAKRKAKSEKWNAAHPDKVREYARVRGQAVRDGTFVSRALPRLTEEEARLAQVASSANRRARKRKNGGRYTKSDIIALLIQQESKCAICGLPFGDDGYHVDHFVPLVRGGTNDPSNLKLTHPTCNLKKGAKLPSELGLVSETVSTENSDGTF